MGKTKAILLLAAAAVIAAGVVTQVGLVESERSVQSLIAEERTLNDRCRGASGDDPRTHKACVDRDVLAQQLGTRGWCYGTEDQAQYQKQWQKCASSVGSQRPPALSAEIQLDQNDADKKEMLRQMEAGMADCSDRLVRGLVRQGERNRSKIARYTATTCGQGLKKFLVMHNVPAGAAEKYAEMIAWKVLKNVLE